MNRKVVIGSLIVIASFAGLFKLLLVPLGLNWAYVIDQLILIAGAVFLSVNWLRKQSHQPLGLFVPLALTVTIVAVHSLSFHRSFFEEFANLLHPFRIASETNNLQAVHDVIPQWRAWRDIYAWSPFAALYELFGTHVQAYANVAMVFLVGGAISAAWLTTLLGGSRLMGLLAGLLVGINPNTFGALPWLSNVIGDNMGVILTCLTVGTWVMARRTKSAYGILLAILLLAATLKGGGAVRTATLGGLLIAADLILFNIVRIKDWLLVASTTLLFVITNYGIWHREQIPHPDLKVGVAGLMDAATRSFIPPTLLPDMFNYLHGITQKEWTVAVGILIFIIGSGIALFYKKWPYLTYGWVWFWGTIFYVPWMASGFPTQLSQLIDKQDMLFAGYKYSYLPLVGLSVMVSVSIGLVLQNRKYLWLLAVPILGGWIWFRAGEFQKLDFAWQQERAIPDRTATNILNSIPNQRGIVKALGKNNPLLHNESGKSIAERMYPNITIVKEGNADYTFVWDEQSKTMRGNAGN